MNDNRTENVMKKFEGIVIASDLDGTFLADGERYVKRNLDAIEYFKANGGLFTIATGRDWFFAAKACPELTELCNAPMIACNGSYICDIKTGEIGAVTEFDSHEALYAIREISKSFPQIIYRVSMLNTYVYEPGISHSRYDFGPVSECVTERVLDDIVDEQWLKVVFEGDSSYIPDVLKLGSSLGLKNIRIISSQADYAELLPPDVNKGKMLPALKQSVAQKSGLDLSKIKISAIGDYFNDYEMIVGSDIPATVLNAPDELKSIPGVYVACDHNDGAIADLIEYIEKYIVK